MKKLDTIEKVLKNKDGVEIISSAKVMQDLFPPCVRPFKPVPHGVNFVQFVKQELGEEGGLGTLHPLDILILGREDLFTDEEKEDEKRRNDDDDVQKSKKLSREKSCTIKTDDACGTITLDGVTYHEVSNKSGPVLVSFCWFAL